MNETPETLVATTPDTPVQPPYEWLEADGLGGFASHTSHGTRTRRYHAILLVSRNPPVDRHVLVNGFDAVLDIDGERLGLTSQTYKPTAPADAPVVHHEGRAVAFSFEPSPWPTWKYDLGHGRTLEHSLVVPTGSPLAVVSWRLLGPKPDSATLIVRPFLSGRDYHSLQRQNADFNFTPTSEQDGRVVFQTYPAEPAVVTVSNGVFKGDGYWYREFLYTADRERGLDHLEDLGSPGTFSFDLTAREALWVLGTHESTQGFDEGSLTERVASVRASEEFRRLSAPSALVRAASAYVVDRGHGKTVLAGYPWFTDWGRDTFISLRGLCLAVGRLGEARKVLVQWASAVSQGMLPNRFTDQGEAPEYNSVDAALWFIVAVHELRTAEKAAGFMPSTIDEWQLNAAVVAILRGYSAGTRHGIRMDSDHLLAAGEPGVQLTWMDAKVGDYVVTPRIGKPVEIQALWINALRIGGQLDSRLSAWADAAQASFLARFWNDEAGYLYDVVDVDHVPGRVDGRVRPNALFAIGGLPFQILTGAPARAVVDLAERSLVTPAGVRSLSPDDPQYRGDYRGGVLARDTAYHQGTIWPFLMGAFVEAWLRTRGGTPEARTHARKHFFEPLIAALDPHGLGHLPEIAEGDAPHAPRGCPFQAWSVGEVLRLDQVVLGRV
ncbi:MAG: amylo-alpha-1,6-glucosidase [Vicinamibacteria bacterium]